MCGISPCYCRMSTETFAQLSGVQSVIRTPLAPTLKRLCVPLSDSSINFSASHCLEFSALSSEMKSDPRAGHLLRQSAIGIAQGANSSRGEAVVASLALTSEAVAQKSS